MPQRKFVTGELQFGPRVGGGGLCESRSSVMAGPTRGRGCKACPGSRAVRQITWECTRAGWGAAGSSDGKCLPSGKPEDGLACGMEEAAH